MRKTPVFIEDETLAAHDPWHSRIAPKRSISRRLLKFLIHHHRRRVDCCHEPITFCAESSRHPCFGQVSITLMWTGNTGSILPPLERGSPDRKLLMDLKSSKSCRDKTWPRIAPVTFCFWEDHSSHLSRLYLDGLRCCDWPILFQTKTIAHFYSPLSKSSVHVVLYLACLFHNEQPAPSFSNPHVRWQGLQSQPTAVICPCSF